MRALTWDALDWTKGFATLTMHKTAKATGESRLIALSPGVLRLLGWLFRWRGRPVGIVFTNGRGGAWQPCSFASYFRKVAKFAGVRLKLSPYSLRHGFTVIGLENNVGDRQLADLLGQASTRYVAWYGRSTRRRGDYLRGVLDQVHGRRSPEKC
jgi:integrase